jgi:hypothetical protein
VEHPVIALAEPRKLEAQVKYRSKRDAMDPNYSRGHITELKTCHPVEEEGFCTGRPFSVNQLILTT